MQLVNLTEHEITIRGTDGDLVIPPSGQVARVDQFEPESRQIDGIPVPVQSPPQYGEVAGLPDPQPGVVYVVSGLVLARVKRADVLAPATGPKDGAIRENGKIVAVTRLNAAV